VDVRERGENVRSRFRRRKSFCLAEDVEISYRPYDGKGWKFFFLVPERRGIRRKGIRKKKEGIITRERRKTAYAFSLRKKGKTNYLQQKAQRKKDKKKRKNRKKKPLTNGKKREKKGSNVACCSQKEEREPYPHKGKKAIVC